MNKRTRLVICVGAVLFILLTCISGYAVEGHTYTINNLTLSITIPDNYAVVTRDINEDDPNLAAFARTKDDMLSFMETSNIYLDAFNQNLNQEIVITGADNDLMDFNNVSDAMLSEWMKELKSTYELNGVTYIKSDIYDNGTMKFIKIYIIQSNGSDTVYGLQYYTVYNNKAINITIRSYISQITNEIETEIKNIVDSADFYVGVKTSDTATLTDGYEYIDNDTNLSFTVPANYTQEALSADRDFVKAKFANNDKNDVCIIYGSGDMFSAMTEEEKKGLRRRDLDNEIFTEKDFAEMIKIRTDEIEKVLYGDKEYYKWNSKTTDNSIGIELQMEVISLTHIENGYMYTFYFSGRESSPYYADFEKLLSSVKYPEYTDTDSSYAGALGYVENRGMSILLGFILTVLIYSLPIIIYRYAIRREPVKPSTAKKITIRYGIVAFMIMSVIIVLLGREKAGYAIFFWSYVNYRILISGYTEKKDIYITDEPQIIKPETKEISFEHICGNCGSRFKVKYHMPEDKTVIPNLKTVCPKCKTQQIINSDDIVNTSLKQI